MPRARNRVTRRFFAAIALGHLGYLGGCQGGSQGPTLVPDPHHPSAAYPASLPPSWEGRVVVADFWATWCRPCLASSPNVQILHDRFGADDRVLVVAVHSDDGVAHNPTQHARQRGYTYPVIDKGQALNESMEVHALPTFIVLDAHGREVHRHVGMLSLKARRESKRSSLA